MTSEINKEINKNDIVGYLKGFSLSIALFTAVRLGILDELYKHPQTLSALTKHLSLDDSKTQRLLNLLLSLSLVKKDSSGKFSSTDLGALFVQSKNGSSSLRPMVDLLSVEGLLAWCQFEQGLLTNKNPFQLAFGSVPFEYFRKDEKAGDRFVEAISKSYGRQAFQDILSIVPELTSSRFVIDVGGGDGQVLTQLLLAVPEASGVIYDLNYVQSIAESHIVQNRLSDRVKFEEGDFFQCIPSGGDLYILSRILHDWDDHAAKAILRNCRRAIKNTGQLLIFEKILPDIIKPDHLEIIMSDLNTFVMCGGKERTLHAYETLLIEEGFKIDDVRQVPREFSIILASPF